MNLRAEDLSSELVNEFLEEPRSKKEWDYITRVQEPKKCRSQFSGKVWRMKITKLLDKIHSAKLAWSWWRKAVEKQNYDNYFAFVRVGLWNVERWWDKRMRFQLLGKGRDDFQQGAKPTTTRVNSSAENSARPEPPETNKNQLTAVKISSFKRQQK